MDISELTIGQAKEIASMFSCKSITNSIDDFAHGRTVIIRTYAAGVWCGILDKKAGNEVILKNARRMWRWWCNKSISLSGVAVHGINRSKSRIAPPVDEVWLEAIEIIPVTGDPAESIMGAPNAEAE